MLWRKKQQNSTFTVRGVYEMVDPPKVGDSVSAQKVFKICQYDSGKEFAWVAEHGKIIWVGDRDALCDLVRAGARALNAEAA